MEDQRDEGKNVMTAPAVIVTRRGALELNAPQSIAESYAAASRRPGRRTENAACFIVRDSEGKSLACPRVAASSLGPYCR
jgi:hypothetical protein